MIRRVKTENGWVKGLPAADPRITSYKGIPFAAPPVGENRWRAPQPCADWEGDLLAHDFGPIAMQAITGYDKENIYTREWAVDVTLPMSEDCLYLNVWAPADPEGPKNLPVYVWYFGGGLQVGNTAEMEFDGERLARRGMVVVTVGYRLNVFGFLSHPEITAENPEKCCNFGFLDQQYATQWVKRNIAAFGGDPDNITIGGQSAGGMSVGAQIGCKANEGLFKRAIVESGVFDMAYPLLHSLEMTPAEAEERGQKFFEFIGAKNLEEARKIDSQTLLQKMFDWEDNRPWCAATDGVFLNPKGPWFTHTDRICCPIFMGNTNNEFIIEPPVSNIDELKEFINVIPNLDKERYLALFPENGTEEEIKAAGRLNAVEFAVRGAARRIKEKGDTSPLYYYSFETDIPGWDDPGAFHSVDLWFFFETLAKCWRPFVGRHYDLARQMCDYWANFIKTGDPNGMGTDGKMLPYWPQFSVDNPVRMTFGQSAYPEFSPCTELLEVLLDARYNNK